MGIEIRQPQKNDHNRVQRLAKISDPKFGRNIAVFNPSKEDIEFLMDIARSEIPGMAQPETAVNLYEHNPECFWAISRQKSDNITTEWPEGFFAILPLNDKGAAALVSGRFNTRKPELQYICHQWERPAAIYFWCIYAPGSLSAALSWWANLYQAPKFNGVPVFAKAGTQSGSHLFQRIGFKLGAIWNGIRNDDFISLLPELNLEKETGNGLSCTLPSYDNYLRLHDVEPGGNDYSCSVAKSVDDLLQVMAVRSVVFIGDQNCPYGEEWDGNDLSATHIIARRGDEPIGTIRLRCFSGFAKVERLAVLPAHRKSRSAFNLERACSELAKAMGYEKLIGHAHVNLLRFWLSRGWRKIEGRNNFVFSDHECVQIEKNISPHKDAIKFSTDPHTLIRPVGRWHIAGPLDQSSIRPAVNKDHVPIARNAA